MGAATVFDKKSFRDARFKGDTQKKKIGRVDIERVLLMAIERFGCI
jgi:hypothetical protein